MTLSLSILVPTRNRPAQCAATVAAILGFDADFELIVYDSSEDDVLAGMLPADPRLRRMRGDSRHNMTQCFEAAIPHATRDFVCMIGDDDGVTPALFDWAVRAAEAGISSVTCDPAFYAMYNWPDVRSKYFGDSVSGKLYLRIGGDASGREDPARSIARFLKEAGQGCQSMPRVYHGLVARRLLDAIRARYGRCFDGVSPDVSFAYFAASLGQPHVVVQRPLAISGQSAGSNAGRSAMREHKGDLWSDPHMQRYRGVAWPSELPAFFSVETVWGQATLSALARAGGEDIRRFDYHRLYARLLLRHRDRLAETMAAFHANDRATGPGLAAALLAEAGAMGMAVGQKLRRRILPDRDVTILPAPDIASASRLTAKRLAA
jgi:hypothetical protein